MLHLNLRAYTGIQRWIVNAFVRLIVIAMDSEYDPYVLILVNTERRKIILALVFRLLPSINYAGINLTAGKEI